MLRFLELYFLIFLSYSMIGWCMEVVVKFFEYRRFINRGFLIGPYCPIYGIGALSVTFFLSGYSGRPVLLFVLSLTIATLIEYFASYIMEKVFHARWWDYSNDKFNINGRVCLATMIPFGILSLAVIYLGNPFFKRVYNMLNDKWLLGICIITGAFFAVDFVVSTIILVTFRQERDVCFARDDTEEMSQKVIKEAISKITWGQKRLIIAFPQLKHVGDKLKKNAKRAIDEYNRRIGLIKEKYYNR